MKYTVNINIYRQMTDYVPLSGEPAYNKTMTAETQSMSAVTVLVKVLSTTKDFKDENKLSAESLMTNIKKEMKINSVVSENLSDPKQSLSGSTIVESRKVSYYAVLLPPTFTNEK